MNELIAFIVTGGALAGGIVWVVKILIAKSIDAGVERYKHGLKVDLESHRHQLELMKIQYLSLNEKQGIVITTLYSLIYDLEVVLLDYTSILLYDWVGDRMKQFRVEAALSDTTSQFEKNRIYFTTKLCNEVERVISDAAEIVDAMKNGKAIAQTISKEEVKFKIKGKEFPIEQWVEQSERIIKEMSNSRIKLADQFRVLIGVEIEK